MEVYVGDMITRNAKEMNHKRLIVETSKVPRHYGMKLNSKNCTITVYSGKFLGYMFNHRGIEENPNKFTTMLDMNLLHWSEKSES